MLSVTAAKWLNADELIGTKASANQQSQGMSYKSNLGTTAVADTMITN